MFTPLATPFLGGPFPSPTLGTFGTLGHGRYFCLTVVFTGARALVSHKGRDLCRPGPLHPVRGGTLRFDFLGILAGLEGFLA